MFSQRVLQWPYHRLSFHPHHSDFLLIYPLLREHIILVAPFRLNHAIAYAQTIVVCLTALNWHVKRYQFQVPQRNEPYEVLVLNHIEHRI